MILDPQNVKVNALRAVDKACLEYKVNSRKF